ncbi:MAG: TlpA disulfide reductase family protein [Bacteroidota bacterium]
MKKIIPFLLFLFSFNAVNAQNPISLNIGQEAPQIKFNSVLGQKLASNFYQRKILVLDFWATWCAPCIASFPHFNSLSAKFKNEKVLFATITDEPELTAVTFFKRTQKQVAAFKLIDTSKVTGQAFGARAIPFCVVIDQNNKVRWKGNTIDLTAQILQEIIDTPSPVVTVAENKPSGLLTALTGPQRPKPVTTYFKFSAIKGTEGKPVGGSSRNSAKNGYYEINRSNIMLGNFLGLLTGYNMTARFITNDSLRLKQLVTIDFSSPFSKGYEHFATEYAGRFIPEQPRTNYLITLLQSTFNFNLKVIEKEMDVYEMIVIDQKKLESFKSLQNGHSSFSDDFLPKFEIVGYNLNGLSQELENSFKKIIVNNITDDDRYDLSLDVSNLKTLNQTLAFHGLQLKEVKAKAKLITIDFK